MSDRWLTIPQACDEVQVTRRTIYNWIASGRVRIQRTASGAIRVEGGSLWGGKERPAPASGPQKTERA